MGSITISDCGTNCRSYVLLRALHSFKPMALDYVLDEELKNYKLGLTLREARHLIETLMEAGLVEKTSIRTPGQGLELSLYARSEKGNKFVKHLDDYSTRTLLQIKSTIATTKKGKRNT